jgi:hypothetical protein
MPPNIDNAERHFHETKRKGVAMAGEPVTEREAILEARIKELEKAADEQTVSVAKGGMFEATWRTINAIVPTWLAGVALAVFLAHHGFVYSMQAQIGEANKRFTQAKADVAKALEGGAGLLVDGEPLRLQHLQAELKLKQEQAKRARAEADALNAKEKDATLRIETVDAEIAATEEKEKLAQAQADAKSETSGVKTLAQREAVAKAIVTEMQAAEKRISAVLFTGAGIGDAAVVRAGCNDNQFAELVGCPAQYLRQKPNSPAPQETRVADKNDALPPPPSPPSSFDCSKAFLSVDYVICSSPQLMAAEARLEDAYRAARAARGDDVKTAQRAWVKSYGPSCGLPAKGQPSPTEIRASRDCVTKAISERTSALQAAASN